MRTPLGRRRFRFLSLRCIHALPFKLAQARQLAPEHIEPGLAKSFFPCALLLGSGRFGRIEKGAFLRRVFALVTEAPGFPSS